MKKTITISIFLCMLVFVITACGTKGVQEQEQNGLDMEADELAVIKTYEVTDAALMDEVQDEGEWITMVKYYEMSDGTWKTDDYAYQYRLEITGRMGNADKDSTFVFLSNREEITFEQAWKASGFSSNMDDYFDEEEAKFVAMK